MKKKSEQRREIVLLRQHSGTGDHTLEQKKMYYDLEKKKVIS